MKALVQRVHKARVEVGSATIGDVGPGLLIFVCAMTCDAEQAPSRLAAKIAKLRIFRDSDGRMNRSLLDSKGAALVVSQFTLAADISRGNRPGFSTAAPPEIAEPTYERFAAALVAQGISVATGRFGADMGVHLVNDGPVTIWLDGA